VREGGGLRGGREVLREEIKWLNQMSSMEREDIEYFMGHSPDGLAVNLTIPTSVVCDSSTVVKWRLAFRNVVGTNR